MIRRHQWSGGGPCIQAISLQQPGDAYSKNSPWRLADPELNGNWKAKTVCTGSGLGDWEPCGADGITWEGRLKAVCLLWLGSPELEAILVKGKISRTPEFLDWKPRIFFVTAVQKLSLGGY